MGGNCNPSYMVSGLLNQERVLREAEKSPYISDAGTTKPWLKLAIFLVATALMIVALFPLVDAVIRHVQNTLPGPAKGDDAPWSPSQEWGSLAINAIAGFAQFVAVLVPACLIYRKFPGIFLWPRQAGGLSLLLIGFGVTFAVVGAFGPLIVQSFGWTAGPMLITSVPLFDRLSYAVAASFALALPVVAEEAIFRGVLLRILGGLTRRVWLIVLVNAFVFSAYHTDPDPVAFVSRMLTGAVWTWSALRLGGIAFAVGSHLGHNLLFGLFLAPLSVSAATNLGWPLSTLAYQIVEVLVVLAVVEVLVRRRRTRSTENGCPPPVV